LHDLEGDLVAAAAVDATDSEETARRKAAFAILLLVLGFGSEILLRCSYSEVTSITSSIATADEEVKEGPLAAAAAAEAEGGSELMTQLELRWRRLFLPEGCRTTGEKRVGCTSCEGKDK